MEHSERGEWLNLLANRTVLWLWHSEYFHLARCEGMLSLLSTVQYPICLSLEMFVFSFIIHDRSAFSIRLYPTEKISNWGHYCGCHHNSNTNFFLKGEHEYHMKLKWKDNLIKYNTVYGYTSSRLCITQLHCITRGPGALTLCLTFCQMKLI